MGRPQPSLERPIRVVAERELNPKVRMEEEEEEEEENYMSFSLFLHRLITQTCACTILTFSFFKQFEHLKSNILAITLDFSSCYFYKKYFF